MKNLLHKIGAFFTILFGGAKKFEQFLEDHVDDGLAIMNKIYSFTNSPLIIAIEDILPDKYKTAVDDIKIKIQTNLEKVIADITGGKDCLTKATFPEKLECLLVYIKTLTPTMQDGAKLKSASAYVQASLGDKAVDYKQSTIDTAVQTRLFAQKNNINLVDTTDTVPSDATHQKPLPDSGGDATSTE